MELVAKIIVLATALVGLYKAAVFGSKRGRSQETPQDHSRHGVGIVSDLAPLAGVFLFMLAFPLFVWAFMAIMQGMMKTTRLNAYSEATAPITLSHAASPDEVMLYAALSINGSDDKEHALEIVVEHALGNRSYRIAAQAAVQMPSTRGRSEQLTKVVNALASVSPAETTSPFRAMCGESTIINATGDTTSINQRKASGG
jgi:hypothetical protein